MRSRNTRLSFGFSRSGNRLITRPIIATEKINPRGKGKPATVVPSYCPFCGAPVDPENPEVQTIPLTEEATHV
ncbi:hypothetical protein DNX69_10710 [Rhodopseudomonas palustris]|uniref:Uncharacterized protein n=1 Tax=Rhodopseudomonas palustris TaxID=1076 RepID=A0A323ULI2_RHOPL|nr:hypothetical protein DNX69_10710 [Rhodopseudomonas palustris]